MYLFYVLIFIIIIIIIIIIITIIIIIITIIIIFYYFFLFFIIYYYYYFLITVLYRIYPQNICIFRRHCSVRCLINYRPGLPKLTFDIFDVFRDWCLGYILHSLHHRVIWHWHVYCRRCGRRCCRCRCRGSWRGGFGFRCFHHHVELRFWVWLGLSVGGTGGSGWRPTVPIVVVVVVGFVRCKR